jgi:ABC-type multidrug transport system fused ATPase/permease subunit
MAVRNNTLSTIRKLYNILNNEQKRNFGLLAVLTFFSSLSDLIGLALVIPVVGLVLSDKFYNAIGDYVHILAHLSRTEMLIYTVILMFVLIVLKNIFGLWVNKLQVNFVKNFFVFSTVNVLNKVYARSLPDLQKDTSVELANKLTTLQITLSSNTVMSLMIIINETMIFGLTAIIASLWNWQLFILLIVITISTLGLFYSRVKNMIRDAGSEKTDRIVDLYSNAQEMVLGYTDIKIAGTEKSFKAKFKDIAKSYSQYQGRLDFMMFIPTRIIEVAIFTCVIIILLYGVFILKDPNKIVATITLFSVIAYRSIPSINRFVMALNNFNATEFIFDDPEFRPEESEQEKVANATERGTAEPMTFHDRIRFDDVSFRYSDNTKYVLSHCNLEVKKGEKIGIIGTSGSGKSTLINNILGFLMPTKGNILIDQTALTEENKKNWWKIVGYVRQDVFIMNATFMENIAIGEPADKINIDRINYAVKLASLTELVKDFPNGLNEMLDERGNNLSGGQKQRISIARAIYKGAEVLIFDEATAALDSKTEEEITNSIRTLGNEHLTIIIIAHRYTSLKYCDKIYSIENGQITNSYTYGELIANVNG